MMLLEVINDFVNEKGYTQNQDCEGIIFYGSRSTGFETEESDVDLQILFNDHPLMRGISIFHGYRFEYFEKTLGDMYGRAVHDYEHQSNVMLSMIGNGITIFDRQGKLEKLKQYVKDLYSNPLPPLSTQEDNEQLVIIANRLIDLKKLALRNDLYFERLYHLTIEKIRNYYYKRHGFPEISTSKVLDLYNNKEYSDKIKKITPPQEFIELFEYSLQPNLNCIERYEIAEKLFNYAKKGNDIDPNNFLIPIKSRNKTIDIK